MKFWSSYIIKCLGWKEEPKGIAKIMSICMLIVIATIFLPTSITQTLIGKYIIYTSIVVFFILLLFELLRRVFNKIKSTKNLKKKTLKNLSFFIHLLCYEIEFKFFWTNLFYL